MSSTTIQADIRDSGGQPLSGYIRVTLDYPVADEATDYLVVPAKIELGSIGGFPPGQATFELEPTDLARVTYLFEIFQYQPGAEILVHSFRAKVPYSATPIKLTELSQTTGIARDLLDSNLSAIVRRLYLSEDFWARAGDALFPPRGEYSDTQWYKRGDVVTWQGDGYRHIGALATIGVNPTDQDVWFNYVSRGLTGAGTTGNNATYSAAGWDGQLDAPSRNAVRDIIETLATKAALDTKVSANGAVLTGATSADNLQLTENSPRLAYTSWVQALIAQVTRAVNPVGIFAPWGTNAAPQYWVICDGRELSRTTYGALFDLWGTSFGTPSSGSVFRTPDFRGRAIAGVDQTALMGAANRVAALSSLGATSGSSTVTITASNLPATYPNIFSRGIYTASGVAEALTSVSSGTTPLTNPGGGQPLNNVQPTIALHVIAYAGV